MAWTAQITGTAKDATNGNTILTFSFTDGTTTFPRIVPSSTWSAASIASYVQTVLSQLDARDAALPGLPAGNVTPPSSVISALQTVWGTTTLPSGVTGTALLAGDTAAQKIAKLNAWTIAGTATPMIVPTYRIYNCLVSSEFLALTGAQQQQVRDILSMATVDASPGTNVRAVLLTLFGAATTTRANLVAATGGFDAPSIPWWQSIGGTATVSASIIAAAGLT